MEARKRARVLDAVGRKWIGFIGLGYKKGRPNGRPFVKFFLFADTA
jgi:hypothetical protein